MKVELRLIGTEVTSYVPKRSWARQEVSLPAYEVLLDGTVVGYVRKAMLTREQRSRGARYVNARWYSPGWVSSNRRGVMGLECYTRTRGVERVLESAGVKWQKAADLAKKATIVKDASG